MMENELIPLIKPLPRILVTGFHKFPPYEVNCTEELVKLISNNPTEFGDNIEIATEVLKVSWAESFPAMADAIQKTQPNAIISFGIGTAEIELEKRAIKVFSGIDVDGKYPPILTEITGAHEYWTTFPDSVLKEMKEKIENISSNISCKIDHHCGCYLCNYLFYRTLHFVQKKQKNMPVLFIHLPQENHLKTCDKNISTLQKVAKEIILTIGIHLRKNT